VSDEAKAIVTVRSSRFGEMTVPAESVITFPTGIIGFPRHTRFVMFDHKPPFSWLHSADDENLAFVVVDGFAFGSDYAPRPPYGDEAIELAEGDEYALVVIVTVRPDAKMTTANLKAPIFVNLKNRRGTQVIYDNPKFSTRHPLWGSDDPA
jgi:flagellar assembly factor FliW